MQWSQFFFFFLIFGFKPTVSLSFFILKRLFSFSSLSAIRVVSSTYLRLLMSFPPIFSACNSSSSACLMMCSAYIFNRVTENNPVILIFQSWTNQLFNTAFWVLLLDSQKVFQETGKMVWYSSLFKSFPQFVMIHRIKGCGIVDETEIDVFLEFPIFLWPGECWQVNSLIPPHFLNLVWTPGSSWFA